ncbi:HAD family hydrolase [Dermatobacter hominis]|uniref:HAD family hydrolase n=1 Tax=Dermatobacter hominis TaxID=2884263 RepID=UPI001D0F7B4E|nr:HAD family hydrolase [Dermatobacter hominis]UDY34083.1 HAD family hydrolase [Dermatobacter hominis]
MSGTVDAVTFDFWNTLVAEGAAGTPRGRRWHRVLEQHGLEVSTAQLAAAMEAGWQWFDRRWREGTVVTTAEAVEAAVAHLPVPVPPDVVDELAGIVVAGTDPAHMVVAPGIGEALERLSSAGVRIGIICDVGMTPSTTLRRYLDHHGLLRHFDHWSFSDEVGAYKPDPVMFEHAAAGLGSPAPGRTAHVGDLLRTDVAGARGAGWISVRYRGLADDVGDDGPEADLVIDHHADLPDLLGL